MGGGKSQTSTQSVSIPPEVLARYNSVNAQAQTAAAQPFSQYGGEFVAPLTQTQQAGIANTNTAATQAQPYYGAATALTAGAAQNVGPLTQDQIGYYQNPYTQAVVNPTVQALQQQQGQQLAQQQAEAIKSGAAFGERSGLQRAQLQGQQNLALGQAIAPLYQQGYGQAANIAAGQQGVVASDLARQMQAGQQIAALGQGAQSAGLQGAQAQLAAGQIPQQTQQALDTALYQQFQQQQGYPFQVAQFLANIAEGTGALSGSTTTTTQPAGFFSDKRLKTDVKKIGKTNDGQPIYSYKYKGDKRTQIGLMAQDVEEKHPEAVGVMGGYKTVDYKKATQDSERPAKYAGGGLVPDGFDPNSMGGAVMPEMSGEGFARGGDAIGPYAGAGLYGNLRGYVPGPMGGSHELMHPAHMPHLRSASEPHHFAMGGMPYAGGYIPDAGQQPQRQLMLPPKLPSAPATGLSSAMETGKNIQGMYNMGKQGLIGSGPTKDDPTGSAGLIGGQGSFGGQNVFSKFSDWLKPGAATGGLIVHRDHYDTGGDVDPYEDTRNSLGDVLKTQESAKHASLNAPGQGPSGGQSGAGQLSSALGLGSALMNFGSGAADFFSAAPEVMAGLLASGGTADRRHYADGGGSLVPDALQEYFSASSGPQPNQLNPSYNLDDGTQLRGLGVFSGPSATYGAGLGIGDPNRSGRFDIDVSRQSAPGSHPQYGGKARYVKSFAEGGIVPRQAFTGDDGDSGAVLPIDTATVDAQPGLVPADLAVEAAQPTGEGAKQKGLAVEKAPAKDQSQEDPRLAPTLGALRRIESGGDYGITGPTSRKGDKPYGAYQIMGANIPSWTQAALGRAMTPEEFLASPEAQDATAKHRAGLYLSQYNDPRQVASMWLSGRPMEKAGDSADVLGTTVPKYVSMFDRYYGGQDLAPGDQRRSGPIPPGLVGRGAQEDGSSLFDKATSANFVVPALGFLGSMLASQRPTLGGALGEGMLGGVGAYQAQQKQNIETAFKNAQIAAQAPITATRNIDAANQLNVGLMQYNAALPPGYPKITLEQFAKISGYTGPLPSQTTIGAQPYTAPAAGSPAVAQPKVGAPEAESSGKPATPESLGSESWSLDPQEKQTLIIHHPGGIDIPAYADLSYLKKYADKYASIGTDWGKQQAESARLAAAANAVKTTDINGNIILTPGGISSEQQAAVASQKVKEAADFNQAKQKFQIEAPKLMYALNELGNVASQFRSGADAAAQANFDRIMSIIDPNYKHPEMHSGAAGNYDTMLKDAMYIGLSQLEGLSPRAPAAELGAIKQTIPNVNMDPAAIQNILAKTKTDIGYKQKMYDAFDIDKHLDVSKFQQEFMNKNPYEDYAKQVRSGMPAGAGTRQASEQGVIPGASQRPDAGSAAQWAKNHPDDPKSAIILQRLGVR